MSATIFISTPSLTISVVIENIRYILNITNFLPKLRLIENIRSTAKSLTGHGVRATADGGAELAGDPKLNIFTE